MLKYIVVYLQRKTTCDSEINLFIYIDSVGCIFVTVSTAALS